MSGHWSTRKHCHGDSDRLGHMSVDPPPTRNLARIILSERDIMKFRDPEWVRRSHRKGAFGTSRRHSAKKPVTLAPVTVLTKD
jgi:hypothetical protein